MILQDIIDLYKAHYSTLNFYYHADIQDGKTIYPDEFVGVASWHDDYLDTTEDPDGWSVHDNVKCYTIYSIEEPNTINFSINLGTW